MSSNNNQEVESNLLGDYLVDLSKRLEPFKTQIVAGIVLLAILVGGFYWYRMTSQETAATATFRALSENAGDLEFAAQNFRDSYAGQLAAVYAGDDQLATGLMQLFSDREQAQQSIDAAIRNYQLAIDNTREPMLLTRANLGMAKAQESIGNVEAAIQHYESVANTSGSEATKEMANEQIQVLRQQGTQQFIAWFQDDFQPVTLEPSMPPALPDLGLPGDSDIELPEIPDLPEIPETTDENAAAEAPGGDGFSIPDEVPMSTSPAEETTAADAAEMELPPEETPKESLETPVEVKPEMDEPKAEEPKVEEPKAEEPKAEEPKAEEPKVEEP
ncbi:MAG: hypothetical protein AAFP69_04170, partial [Planctomycetota bacterium]